MQAAMMVVVWVVCSSPCSSEAWVRSTRYDSSREAVVAIYFP